ncbi:MAG: cell division protein ZipA [Oceanospirillaceae bacterium]|nr:cell division protein ZipA [Oceanospirillaceae bacterium]
MEISLREWLIIGGILVIALIIFDGWRRIRGNRNRIRMDIDRSGVDSEGPDEDPYVANPELPNGGARVRRAGDDEESIEPEDGRREPTLGSALDDDEPSDSASSHKSSARSATRTGIADTNSLKEMDPLFDDVPVEPKRSKRRPPEPKPHAPLHAQDSADSDDELSDALSQGQFDGFSLDDQAAESGRSASARGASADAAEDDYDNALSMSLDFDPDQPIPVLMDRVRGSGRGAVEDVNTESQGGDAQREADQETYASDGFSLDLDESANEAGRDAQPALEPEPQAGRSETGDRKRPAPEITPDPEDMLVIFVVAKRGQVLPGAGVRRIVEACGMEYGELEVFHRHENPDASGSLQFSMANAIQPGTFDLETMDEEETPAVTFFMSMRDPNDPLYAYECMLATAETLARHLDAELLDGDRSVMRPQTKEHYRERIRDFQIHKRVKRGS